eukprot:1161047-Pelagomonas_calceolata.AAC.1
MSSETLHQVARHLATGGAHASPAGYVDNIYAHPPLPKTSDRRSPLPRTFKASCLPVTWN